VKSFLFAFCIACATSGLLSPIVRRIAIRYGAMSMPGRRHVNERAVPRLGGIAICLAVFVPLLAFYFLESSVAAIFRGETPHAIGLFVGGLGMCTLGILDDTRRVRAVHKLLVQLVIAVLAFGCGFRIDAVSLPILGTLSMGIFSLPISVLWIVGIVNAINLIDGLDGLAAGIVFFAGLTNFIVAYIHGSPMVALLMSAMLGATTGFLFHNFNPARIFMGDSGSYFLGYILATSSLLGSMQPTSTAVALLVPMLAMGVPIFDTLFAIVRRFLERRPLFSPDRGHIHHRLVDMGITHRRAVLILYGTCALFTFVALGVALGKSWHVGVAIIGACVLFIGLSWFVGYFDILRGRARLDRIVRSRDAELLRRVIADAPLALATAATEEDVWTIVRSLVGRAEVAHVALLERGAPNPVQLWTIRDGLHPGELVSAHYPIGRDAAARATLRFTWESDSGTVSPQSDVLLQVLVDLVARELQRLQSPFAPIPAQGVEMRARPMVANHAAETL
jgi:UDP-GlcNAc:undecaprenyl-phosphate GlcNAc-1-phosphate transferase